MMRMGELLDAKGTAAELGVSLPRIYQLWDAGQLWYVQTEWGRMSPRGAIERYRLERATKGRAGVPA